MLLVWHAELRGMVVPALFYQRDIKAATGDILSCALGFTPSGAAHCEVSTSCMDLHFGAMAGCGLFSF